MNVLTHHVAVIEVVRPGQVVRLSGRLDASTVADVRGPLTRLLDQGTGDLRMDVADLVVADPTGLGLLVGLHRRARSLDRRLVLVDVPDRLDRLIRVTRWHRVLVRSAHDVDVARV
jgi:anti-sigma B factor antagonist